MYLDFPYSPFPLVTFCINICAYHVHVLILKIIRLLRVFTSLRIFFVFAASARRLSDFFCSRRLRSNPLRLYDTFADTFPDDRRLPVSPPSPRRRRSLRGLPALTGETVLGLRPPSNPLYKFPLVVPPTQDHGLPLASSQPPLFLVLLTGLPPQTPSTLPIPSATSAYLSPFPRT